MDGWLEAIINWLVMRVGVIWGWIMWLYAHLAGVLVWIWDQVEPFFKWIKAGAKAIAGGLLKAIRAVLHLNFRSIWSALKRGYNRILQGLDWWRRHVLGPLDRMRRQIWQIYRTFFKPIILFIDSLRVFTRMIAIFNRKLAARLDHYLMSLEGKILWPITALLKRVNEISSYFTALITTAGRLARSLLLESLRRDALLVWEVLTNPRGMIYKPAEPMARPTIAAAGQDFREYLQHGTGPLSMTEVEDHASFLQGFEEAS